MRESLWRIVTGEETAPTRGSESEQAKFASRRDRALATIVLTVDTSLLYLIGTLSRFGRSWPISLRRKRGQLDWTWQWN